MANLMEQLRSEPVAAICRKYGAAKLSLFGSQATGAAKDDSDVDLLVEFKPGVRVSLLDLGGMLMDLRDALGRDVDLRTPQDLSEHFRDEVVRDARLLYAA